MEVHFTPDVEKKLNDLAAQSGRGTDELLQDALAAYFDELVQTRDMLDSRYDELKSGRVKPVAHQGHRRPDLSSRPLRFTLVREFLIAYAPEEKPLCVAR
jgi:hypothetical protein